LPAATSPSDAELIARARMGDARAHHQLRARHAGAAQRLAHGLGHSGTAGDDIVDDAFVTLGREIERGRGPDVGYRTELLTTLWRVADGAVPPARSWSRLALAYSSLPEQWQAVLWYADIERVPSVDIETYLGVGATDLAALTYRARTRLRQAYLTLAPDTQTFGSCRPALDRIEAYLLGALSGGERVRVERHLHECTACRDIAAELGDLRAALVGAVAPEVLGTGWEAYLTGGSVDSDESPGRAAAPGPNRRRPGRSRAGVGVAAAVTVLLVGMLTWIVYGASTASVSGAEVAAEAEQRGELEPAEPAAESVATTTGTADQPATTGTQADSPESGGQAPSGGAPAGSATHGSGDGSIESGPAATGAPATSTTSSSTSPPASSPQTNTGAAPAPVPPAPPSPAPAPPTTLVTVNPPTIVAVPTPAPTADLALATSGTYHGSVTVTVVVKNAGPQAAAAPNVDFVLRRLPRSVPAGCSANHTRLTVSCSFGTLAANRHVQVGLSVVDGPDVVGVRVLSSTLDPKPANNLWTILPGSISLDRPLTGLS
jgi:DNA-directed RNA polymerase specialized sigma24 family protein